MLPWPGFTAAEISGMVTRQNRLERKTLLEGNSRVAAVALRQDRGDSGAGHGHDYDDHPHHQGLEMGRSPAGPKSKQEGTRRRRREAERTSRSRRMADTLWPTRFIPMTTMDKGGGDVREIAQGEAITAKQRDPERIEQDAQQGGQVGGGEQDRAPGGGLGVTGGGPVQTDQPGAAV